MTKRKLVSEVKNQFKASRELYEQVNTRRDFNLELYTGFYPHNRTENVDGLKIHVPYTKTLLDNTLPMLVAKLPISKSSPRSQKFYTAAKFMDNLIDFTFDVNNFTLKFPLNQKESMLAGDHFDKVVWNPDPEKNYPLITPIDVKNITTHVNKLDLEDDWPLFVSREMTKKQMKEETGWDKDAIDTLGESKLGDKSYRREQLKKLGMSPGQQKKDPEKPDDDLYEVIERWGMMDFKGGKRKMGVVVVANDEVILNPKPLYDGLEEFESSSANNVLPFAHLPYDPIPNSFLSMSFIDPIATMQVELNDLEGLKKSNYIRRNNPPLKVSRNANVDLTKLKFMAGLPWLTDDINGIDPFILPDLAQSIELQQTLIRRTMQNVTGASDILMTAPETQPQGLHRVQSAAHAQILQESIKMRFTTQAQLIDRYVERIGKLLINLWQDKRFWSGMNKVSVAIGDDEGTKSLTDITNEMVQGELDFVVTAASSLAQSNQAKVTSAVNFIQMFGQDPTLNMEPLKRIAFDEAGFDYNSVVKPKASYLPVLQQKLEQLITITKDPKFKLMPTVEQQKVVQQIQMISQQIKQLSLGQEGQGPQQPDQTMQGQGLQPQGAQ